MLVLEQLPYANYDPGETQGDALVDDLILLTHVPTSLQAEAEKPFGLEMIITIQSLGRGAVNSKPKISYDTEGYPDDTTYLDPVK
jgi:hypothetical protein